MIHTPYKYKPKIGTNGCWYETTQEWHGADEEFSCDNGKGFVSVGGKGKYWDVVFHKTRGNFEIIERYLGFEKAIKIAEEALDKRR